MKTRLLAIVVLLSAAAWPQQDSGPQPDPVKALPPLKTTILITATPVEPAMDRRNTEVFTRTLFSRDDQIFHVLDAGINAGQHEGGGKSLEIRRFGYNLDHGGVAGGLKVLVDNVQQNQGTQGHGQGYLGSLKSLSAELVEGVDIINGPFSAEYGDFSGLGVVHIRTRDSMPDVWTIRLQGGSFGSERAFFSFSPAWKNASGLFAYEGSHTDGPFLSPGRYTRHNLTGNYTRQLNPRRSLGFKYNIGSNDFYSSGQIPLDEVAAGRLDRFGYIDPSNGGRVRAGTGSIHYRQEDARGGVLKVDGFVTRSLFDLYSNFTFFLLDPVRGDAFQQHDSRLIEGANAQYQVAHKLGAWQALFTTGGNLHDNQINVGLYPSENRVPTGVTTSDRAHVSNGAAYLQESVTALSGRLVLGGGLRLDEFRFAVAGRDAVAVLLAQPKANVSFRPSISFPVTLYANYGRGISSADARGVVQHPEQPAVSTTDFWQVGASQNFGRVSTSVDAFWIDRSNEQVYVPDDGSFEFKGPSRAYGVEARASVELTHHWTLNGGVTKVANAFYPGTFPRLYVDSAPHFTANAGLTLAGWHGWSGSLRMRAINHYHLDGEDPSVIASGHTVFDLGLSRRIFRGIELSLALDNLTDRDYYETQNYFESRLPGQAPAYRIHGTPGYPVTATVGLTFRLKGK
ncbi:MAG: TonB-dependent receptor plug domain-containing protein [Candidatus Solibacter sp.]